MHRRRFLSTASIVAVTAASAGCADILGGDDTGQGDETTPDEAGNVFDVDVSVNEEQMGQEVEMTSQSLFQTATGVGVRFVLTNRSGGVLTDVTANARLLGENDDTVDTFETSLQQESIDELAQNEEWYGDIVFEGIDAEEFGQNVATVEVWATAQAEST